MRMKESEWDDVIDTNLKVCLTVFKVTTNVKTKSGSIINLSSVVGAVGNQAKLIMLQQKQALLVD